MLPTFITVPRPHKRVYTGQSKVGNARDRIKGSVKVYFTPDELDQVRRTAVLCDCTVSELLRQLGMSAVATLGVRDGTGSDE